VGVDGEIDPIQDAAARAIRISDGQVCNGQYRHTTPEQRRWSKSTAR
jgi:hypothetical protein